MELSVFLYFFTIICYNLNCRVPAWSAGKSGILVSAALLIFFNQHLSTTKPGGGNRAVNPEKEKNIQFSILSIA